MNDIIFDLLSIGRTTRAISPEVSLTWLYFLLSLNFNNTCNVITLELRNFNFLWFRILLWSVFVECESVIPK